MKHLPSNSHAEMIDQAGWGNNKPNRKVVVFEAEWSGEGDLPSDGALIRNSGECPERLTNRIRSHYQKLKEALSEGKHLSTYFKDTKVFCDVWNMAIQRGAPVTLPRVFKGSLAVYGSAKLDAPALTEVGGYLDVYGSAKLDAPALTEVGGYLAVSGSAKLDALAKVGGYLAVSGSAKLDAPALNSVNGKPYRK